ncbi:MAG TPA: HAMP domain-containing sensor histidine kinase [Vicinamibacterales bacterium]|nr:HAMP domain-containing sensor histidine kinase [Vicinamibacterales bacterium]
MKLRARLALTTFIVSAGTIASVSWLTNTWRERQADGLLANALAAATAPDRRAACEQHAESFGGGYLQSLPPLLTFEELAVPAPQLFAYDAAFRSANREAPPFPPALQTPLARGAARAGGSFPLPFSAGRQLAARTPWPDGPCAIVLARFGAFSLPESTVFMRVLFAMVATGLIAFVSSGWIISRFRRLAAAVQKSAESMYAIGVPVTAADEIGELEMAFNRAAEQVRSHLTTIQDREAALRSVVSNTAHDVAVPLTVVQGHLSSLYALVPAGNAQEELRGAIRETHYLAGLLHNLSIAARLDRPAPDGESRVVDLCGVVDRAVARHRPLARTLDVELDSAVPENPVAVRGDETLLEQAVSNLVHNAIHYNRPGGHVAVVLETAGGSFLLRVLDDGPGIPAEERARLTEPAFRGASGRARRPDGQGLGLHIVGEVIRRHGFVLTIGESEYGGAVVSIRGEDSGKAGGLAADTDGDHGGRDPAVPGPRREVRGARPQHDPRRGRGGHPER